MPRLLTCLTAVLLLTGCATTSRDTVKVAPIVTKPPLKLKDPPPLNLDDVEWIVITPENQEAIFKKLKAQGDNAVLFALTDKGYKSIRMNDARVLGYIKKQKGLIAAFRRYYE